MDKFYTKPHIAQECIQMVFNRYPWNMWDLVVEPSAGNGSFFHQLPIVQNKIAMDIAPEHPSIHQQDFLTFVPDNDTHQRILTIGNPPFGKVSSMAIQFFNHASKWSTVIAFIVPRTFRRVSVQNKLNPSFHLVFDYEIPIQPCAFEPSMMAKCCFQIWEKQEQYPRDKVVYPSTHPDWDFLKYGPLDERNQPTPPVNADFAIRAYGGRCGEIRINQLDQLRPKSWHWISSKIDKDTLIERFRVLDYSQSVDTARQNSIGKRDLVHLYQEHYYLKISNFFFCDYVLQK